MLKYAVLLSFIFLASLSLKSQQYDLVVTQTDDSIVCKVQDVSTFSVTYETLIDGDWTTVECGADCLSGVYYNVARKNQYEYEDGTLRVIGRKKRSKVDESVIKVTDENTDPIFLKNNHYINIGLGIGQTYGGYGIKTIIGKNNTGVLLGAGRFSSNLIGYAVGFQLAYKVLYANANYGVVNSIVDGSEEYYVLSRYYMVGGMIDLGSKKDFIIDVGGGNSGYYFCLHLGIMYRIGW